MGVPRDNLTTIVKGAGHTTHNDGMWAFAHNLAVEPTGYALRAHPAAHRWRSAGNNRSGRCRDMRPKPKQFATQYASMFGDASVVSAYQYRPPYPPETFEILLRLLDADADIRTVLDAGCGPGLMARQLAQAVDRVDAVDIAARMLALGKALPGGEDPKLCWIHGAMEDVPLHPPYALIVAAASLHWMHWETVLPRFHAVLTPGDISRSSMW